MLGFNNRCNSYIIYPLQLMTHPPKKEAFKQLIKAKVMDYWETKLCLRSSFLPSLAYFQPEYMSLASPHRLWTSSGHNTYEVGKARIQLLFLSSQYPCG